jgi:hypothetical protein
VIVYLRLRGEHSTRIGLISATRITQLNTKILIGAPSAVGLGLKIKKEKCLSFILDNMVD